MCQTILRTVRHDEQCVSLISSLGYTGLHEWLLAGTPVMSAASAVNANAQLKAALGRLRSHASKLKCFDDYLENCGNVLMRSKKNKIECSIDAFMHQLDALEALDERIRRVVQLAARHEREMQTSREIRHFAFLCIAFLSKKFVQCHRILTLAGNCEEKERSSATTDMYNSCINYMRRFEIHAREIARDSASLQNEEANDCWNLAYKKINDVGRNSSLKPFVDIIKCSAVRLQAHVRIDVGKGDEPLSKVCPHFYELSKIKENVRVPLQFTQLSIRGDIELISIQIAERIMESHRFERRRPLIVNIVDPTIRFTDGTTDEYMHNESFVDDVSCRWTSDGSSYNVRKFLLTSPGSHLEKTTPKFSVVVCPQGAPQTVLGRTEEFGIRCSKTS